VLRIETVEPGTFSILKKLISMPALQDFHLVGETALSLMYGYQTSVDLDLFTITKFENTHIIDALQKEFSHDFVMEDKPAFFGIFCYIDNVKADIVRFPDPLIRPTLDIDGIRMCSPEEIVAMKVQAILGRGKMKYF